MRLALLILAAGLCSAQTTVTLNGSNYTLMEGPIGLLDGPCAMGAYSASTDYHDLEAVSLSGTWYRALKQNGPSTSIVTPGTDATVWAASTLNLTGSGATFTCNLWGTSGSGRAQLSNPAYSAMKSAADTMVATTYANAVGAAISWHGVGLSSGNLYGDVLNCALMWAASGAPDSSNYLNCALTAVRHPEDFDSGASLCDETQAQCGSLYYQAWVDNGGYYAPFLATIYTIVRDKLTPTERQNFANVVWNDLSAAHNGLGIQGSTSTDCTKPVLKNISGTITTQSWQAHINNPGGVPVANTLAVVGVGTHFTTDLAVNDILWQIGHIASITDDTHLTLYAPASNDNAGVALNTVALAATTTNICGIHWQGKHHASSPTYPCSVYASCQPGGAAQIAYQGNYPTNAGSYCCEFINLTLTKEEQWIILALVTASDDPRPRTALTSYYGWWSNDGLPTFQQHATGFYYPRGYISGRDHWMNLAIVHGIQNSVTGFNSAPLKGVWLSEIMPFWYGAGFNDPVERTFVMPFDGELQDGTYGARDAMMASFLFPGTNQASYVNYYLKTTRGDYSTSVGGNPYTPQVSTQNAGMMVLYNDPSISGSLAAPTQHIFDLSNLNASGGASSSVTACNFDSVVTGQDCRLSYWASHSDYSTTGSTVFSVNNWYDGRDHQSDNGPNWLQLSIYRQAFLLGGDGIYGDSNYIGGRAVLAIGGLSNYQVAAGTTGWPALETRWAGAHPDGVTSNKYAYACNDARLAYQTTVTAAQRCVAHMKAGTQDYVYVYDYVAVPVGTTIESIWPLYKGADVFGRTNTVSAGAWTSGRTSTVTASASSLAMAVLNVAGTNTLAGINPTLGTQATILYLASSSNGSTANTSATSMESLVAFKADNTTSPTMPAITQPSAGSNWTCAQVADSGMPKIGCFARGTGTQTSISFTSTHAGTGSYLVAGLTAGSYAVSVSGTSVGTCVVSAGDNTCYFESTAGAVVIGSGSTLTCSPKTGLTPPNVQDIQLETNMALGVIACTNDIASDHCGTTSVQRVVNAALGGACVLGP